MKEEDNSKLLPLKFQKDRQSSQCGWIEHPKRAKEKRERQAQITVMCGVIIVVPSSYYVNGKS
jgi:hypothetical protein